MQSAGSRLTRKAWLAAALGLGALLGCHPAQAGNSTRLEVSAVILARVACGSVSESGGQPKCSGSDPRTSFRVRSDRDVQARGSNPQPAGTYKDPVVLTIEP